MPKRDLFASFLPALLFAALAFAADEPAKAAKPRPNILIILADDMGYGELSCQGNPQIPTPNIDSIAKNGIRFTSGYVSAPVCSPTRAGLMMGRYQQRFGHEFNPGGGDGGLKFGLPAEKTFAEQFKDAGYATGMFGKWHLGYTKPTSPLSRGFDWCFGFLPACRPYPFHNGDLGKSLLPNLEQGKPNYTTEAFAAEAAAFIELHRDKPWFVYLPFNAVHCPPGTLTPQSAPPKYRDRFPGIIDGNRRIYAGMESALDDAVGVVLEKLRQLRLEENTLIFFFSDNGGPTWQTTSRNDPLRGQKGDVLEGGVRIPFMLQWKGRLPAGIVDDRPVIQLDILPTALAAAGLPLPTNVKLDGVNLLPYLSGERKDPPHEALFWRYGAKRAVRMGDWKLADQGDGAKLYNLAADIGEKTNLSLKDLEKLKALESAYAKWNAQNIPAKFGHSGKAKPGKAGGDPNEKLPPGGAEEGD